MVSNTKALLVASGSAIIIGILIYFIDIYTWNAWMLYKYSNASFYTAIFSAIIIFIVAYFGMRE